MPLPLVPLLFVFPWLAGCACTYDPELVARLESAKLAVVGSAEQTGLYDAFTTPDLPAADVAAARDHVGAVVQTAAADRTPGCDEPLIQATRIKAMFERHVRSRVDRGPWTPAVRDDHKQNMAEAFDIALRTQQRLR